MEMRYNFYCYSLFYYVIHDHAFCAIRIGGGEVGIDVDGGADSRRFIDVAGPCNRMTLLRSIEHGQFPPSPPPPFTPHKQDQIRKRLIMRKFVSTCQFSQCTVHINWYGDTSHFSIRGNVKGLSQKCVVFRQIKE